MSQLVVGLVKHLADFELSLSFNLALVESCARFVILVVVIVSLTLILRRFQQSLRYSGISLCNLGIFIDDLFLLVLIGLVYLEKLLEVWVEVDVIESAL